MKIISLKLIGLKYFTLSDINEIEIDFNKPTQVMLGPNGYGKSRLMQQISPLPAVIGDYKSKGFKEVVLVANNKKYTLTSVINEKHSRHTFKLCDLDGGNETVLNDAGTATLQKQLIEEHFKYNDRIHKILTGRTRFTKMPPTAVMKTLLSISGLDLDYALGVHKDISETLRDKKGASNHYITKISDAKTRLESIKVSAVDKQQKELLDKNIIALTKSKNTSVTRSTEEIKQSMVHNNAKIDSFIERANNPKYDKVRSRDFDEQEMTIKLAEIEEIIHTNNGRLAQLYKALEEAQGELSKLRDGSNPNDITELRQTLSTLEDKVKVKPRDYDENKDYSYLVSILTNLHIASVQCQTTVSTFYTKEQIDNNRKQLTELNSERLKLESLITNIKNRIKLSNDAKKHDMDCPECGTRIRTPNSLSDKEQYLLDDNLKQTGEKLNKLLERTTKVESLMQDMEDFIHIYKSCHHTLSNHREALELVQLNVADYVKNSSACGKAIHKLLIEVKECDTYKEAQRAINEKKTLIKLIESNTYEKTTKKEKELLETIEDVTRTKQSQETLKKELSALIRDYHELKDKLDDTSSIRKDLIKDEKEFVISQINEVIDKELSDSLDKLAILNTAQTKEKQITDHLNDLVESQDTLDKEIELYKLLETIISPKTGIIADQMQTYMTAYCNEVNAIISKIFGDEIRIDSSKELNSFDYKFPIVLNGEQQTDMSEASDGQRDVVDLAFCIVMLKMLGLDNYPLFLDETGNRFDASNRSSFVMYLQYLLQTDTTSQLFIISHFNSIYGALSEYDVIALGEVGIDMVDKIVNENVKIK